MLSKQNILHVFIFAISMMLSAFNSHAQQLKLGNNPTSIEKSSVLQLDSKNQGLLLTRLSDITAINSLHPPDGMLIYLTKGPDTGVYVRRNGGWRQSDQVYQVVHPTGAIKFTTSNDTVTLNIPNASTDRGVVSTTPSGQTFHGDKIFQDSLVALSTFRSDSDATINNNLILKKSPKTLPGYLLSTDANGKVLLQTHPNTWIVGGNTIASGASNKIGTTSNTALPIVTNSHEQMRVTSDGKTGIATPSPTDTLDVKGSFELGRGGSSFEKMGEGTSEIKNYLEQINVANLIVFGDTTGAYVFTLNVPGVKKNAWITINPDNDWTNLNMKLSIHTTVLFVPVNLDLPLGGTKIQIAWAISPEDSKINVCLLFDFRGVANLNSLINLINTIGNLLLNLVQYSSTPIGINILYCNPQ